MLTSEGRIRRPAKYNYFPFQKLQPKKVWGLAALSHSLPLRVRRVLLFLVTYWSAGFLDRLQIIFGESAPYIRQELSLTTAEIRVRGLLGSSG